MSRSERSSTSLRPRKARSLSAILTTYQSPHQLTDDGVRLNFFFSLWPNRYQSIIRPSQCQSWVTISRFHQLTDDEIYTAVSLSDTSVFGCRWGKKTRFAVLDIDTGSDYYNQLGLARIKQALTEVSLTGSLYQSSESGGWHLYIFFDDWEDSSEVNEKLKAWLKEKGFKIRCGQLEFFPSGNGLRLPLQKGFAWLAQDGQIETRREDFTTDEAIQRFLSDLDRNKNHWLSAKKAIEEKLEKTCAAPTYEEKESDSDDFTAFFDRSGLIPDVYEKGRIYWANGLTNFGQRHDAIYCLGHYMWYGDEAENVRPLPGISNAALRAKIIIEWLEDNHNGFSEAINSGSWAEVKADVERACSWSREETQIQKYEPYPLTERLVERLVETRVYQIEDFHKANEKRMNDARSRIKKAVEHCQKTGQQITRNQLAEISGSSPNTVSKHKDLWVYLTTGSGEYSVVFSSSFDSSLIYLIPSGPGGAAVVAPRSSSQAEKPITRPQCQNQELETGLDVLTPGPRQRDIEAGTAGSPGGILVKGAATIRVNQLLPFGKRAYSGTSHIVPKSTPKLLGKSQLSNELPVGFASGVFRRDPDRATRITIEFAPGLLTKSGISKQTEEDLKASSGAAWREPHLNYFRLNLVCYFRDKQNRERNKRGSDRSNQPEFDLMMNRSRGPPRRNKQ